jgi:hypothetical protein
MKRRMGVLGLLLGLSVLGPRWAQATNISGTDSYVGLQALGRTLGIKLNIDERSLAVIGSGDDFKARLVKAVCAKLIHSGLSVSWKGQTLGDGMPQVAVYLWARRMGSPGHAVVGFQYSLTVAAPIKLLTRDDVDSGVAIVWEHDQFGTIVDSPEAIQGMLSSYMVFVDKMVQDFKAARAAKQQV